MSRPGRRITILLAALLALSSPSLAEVRSTPVVAPPEPQSAQAWLERADDLWHVRKDYNGALKAFNRAVAAAPEDPVVRNARAMFFDVVSEIVVAEDRSKFSERAREDWQWVANREPDSILGGVARDGLTRLDGKVLVQPRSVSCPAEAAAAHERAESLYGARQLDAALAEYENATSACPDAAIYWVNYADAYYGLGKYSKAKELFERALVADPWQRSGHRFLADTEAKLAHPDAAIHQAALAVVSDPTYEAAWASLRLLAEGTGRGWDRVYATKAAVSSAGIMGKGGSDDALWMLYSMAKVSILKGKGPSALEAERYASQTALALLKDGAAARAPFWSMIARAQDAGYLDEAIFLHMLDAPLAADYPAFREKNGARLAEYLETLIVPKKHEGRHASE
jgi:tetratricopeptide (TPR) repeat protein